MVDMGVEAYLVASSLVAVLAQRLVRVLCVECREAYTPTAEALAEIGISPEDATDVFHAVGCGQCHHTGYRGRIGIFELMLVDDPVRGLVTQSIDAKTIKRKATSKGMRTLRADGARKALQGITSIAEVLRATEEEGAVAQI